MHVQQAASTNPSPRPALSTIKCRSISVKLCNDAIASDISNSMCIAPKRIDSEASHNMCIGAVHRSPSHDEVSSSKNNTNEGVRNKKGGKKEKGGKNTKGKMNKVEKRKIEG